MSMNTPRIWFKLFIVKVLFALFLLGVWWLIYWLQVWPSWMVPSPGQVGKVLWKYLSNQKLLWAVLTSLQRIVIGFSISVVIGTLLGFVLAKVAWLRQTLGFFVMGLQTLPSICWLPLALLWFGLNESAIIFVLIMGAVLSITIAVQGAINTIPPLLLRAGRMLGATGFKLYRHVIFHAILPNFITGLKQGWSFAWRSLMAGEMLFITTGLGQLLMTGRELNDMALVIAIMITIVVLGVVVDYFIFGTLERSLRQRWGLLQK